MVVSGVFTSFSQQITDSEVPGDNFSLEGALELFKKSSSPEEFEKMLNSPDSKVNNLDLNGDGYIDYIRVLDRYEGNVHAFILQAVISETENQDIAVIELEKLANGKAVLQIVGDEDIYGVETIIEPTREVRTYAGTMSSTTVVNVWAWPSVQYVYGPFYRGWYSPWSWHVRPIWWRSWRPVAYVHYYSTWQPYWDYYTPCYTRRVVYAHHIYRPYRCSSVIVYNRHHERISRYRSNPRDDHRRGRTRDDGRRADFDNDRSATVNTDRGRRNDSDVNRGSSVQRNEVIRRDRSNFSGERSMTNDGGQRSTEISRDDFTNRRSSTVHSNREVRTQVTTPAESRSRTFESPRVQRSATRQQSVPRKFQRNSSEVNRDDFTNRRPATIQSNREIRQEINRPSENRIRSFENNTPQRSVNRERSFAPQTERNSSGASREDFTRRSSGTVQSHRELRPETSRPAENRSRSFESRPGGQQHSGDHKRGRH